MSDFFKSASDFFARDINHVGRNGLTRLQQAILDNDIERLSRLVIAYNADVNEVGLKSQTPLLMALDRERPLCVRLLIAYGADVNRPDGKTGMSPLHLAVCTDDFISVQSLLNAAANPNARDRQGNTPLHFARKPSIIRSLYAAGADPNAQNDAGDLPLDTQAQPENTDTLLTLLSLGANPRITTKPNGTPRTSPFARMLHWGTNHPVIQSMLRMGVNLEDTSSEGYTTLLTAAACGDGTTFLRLLDGANLRATDVEGYNALHHLINNKMETEILHFLRLVPEMACQPWPNGSRPLAHTLDLLAEHNNKRLERIALTLIGIGRADINTRMTKGASGTLLHYACLKSDSALVRELIALGADSNLSDKSGVTPIHIAIKRKDIEVLDILLDAGANPDQTDKNGWTLLDKQAARGDRDSPIVQRLIVAGGQYRKQLPLNPALMRPQPVLGEKEDSDAGKKAPSSPIKIIRKNGTDFKPPR